MFGDFYEDLRYCRGCNAYVRYLQSPGHAYCVECGGRVKIFSREDLVQFKRSTRRPLVTSTRRRGGESDGPEDPRLVS